MELVWYVAYGSNLDRSRFDRYIVGGRHEGAGRGQPGCVDPTPPRATAPCTLAHRLYFARSSLTWSGGGVAFIDPDPDLEAADDPTLGRRYLITGDQFADVWAQECGLVPPATVDRGRGWYDQVVELGELDGVALRTFTSSSAAPSTPPSPAYRATIERGLVAAHALTRESAADYVDRRIGFG